MFIANHTHDLKNNKEKELSGRWEIIVQENQETTKGKHIKSYHLDSNFHISLWKKHKETKYDPLSTQTKLHISL